jgi:eukaryotic-like serine/threonine-protein kinase
MAITLTVIAGPLCGKVFSFRHPDRFLVGRSPRAHLRLEHNQNKDPRASRLHFLVEINPPLCRLYDLGSHNGTYVNGQRVTTQDLHHGNEIRAGHTVLRVGLSDDLGEETQGWAPGPELAVAPFRPKPASPVPKAALCLCCNTTPAAPLHPVCLDCLQRGQQAPQPLPGYMLLRQLGRGSMGVVHLALRLADKAVLAVKTIQPEGGIPKDLVEPFLREANRLRELRHEHIVPFRDVGTAGKLIYVVMDHVAGVDAAQLLKGRGFLSIRSAVRIILQLLQALEHAHQQQFVHGDLKPANLLLDTTGERMSVKAADFGLARLYRESQLSGLSLQKEMDGTFGFMPPEQITNFRAVEPSSDQYSAAATLYTLLTGQGIRDLTGPLCVQLDKILKEEPAPIQNRRPDLPDRLAAVIHRALTRSPRKRFADVARFRQALRPFAL